MASTEDHCATPLQDEIDLAAELFVRRRSGALSVTDAAESRLAENPKQVEALRGVEQAWQAVGKHAGSPELMALREQALARARQAGARRWRGSAPRQRWRVAAAAAGVAVAVAAVLQISPYGYRPGLYSTALGELRTIELADHSRLILDSRTKVRVRYSDDARIVQLLDGQAQFSVAKDPSRPFKVQAGEKTIVALGTVFTVDYADREIHIAMLEGRVAVMPQPVSGAKRGTEALAPGAGVLNKNMRAEAGAAEVIELAAGEELRVRADGRATLNTRANLEVATAWRQGKVIFDNEPLGEAVRRFNRYSQQQMRIEDSGLAQLKVSGVFEIGDHRTFIEALRAYLPIAAEEVDDNVIRLTARTTRP